MSEPRESPAGSVTPRAQPFFCPYCGEQDIRPAEGGPNLFHCELCDRLWSLEFKGLSGTG